MDKPFSHVAEINATLAQAYELTSSIPFNTNSYQFLEYNLYMNLKHHWLMERDNHKKEKVEKVKVEKVKVEN